MTKKQLIEVLKDMPDSMEIFIRQVNDDFGYSLVNVAEERELEFQEDADSHVLVKDTVFVLTDDI